MKKIIEFNQQKSNFIKSDGDFAERWKLSKDSIGAIEITTYQGKLTVDANYVAGGEMKVGAVSDKKREHNQNIEWTIKRAIEDAAKYCDGVGENPGSFETVLKRLLNAKGIKVIDINVENAVQEMFEVSNRAFSPNILKGNKKSLILDQEQPQPGFGE